MRRYRCANGFKRRPGHPRTSETSEARTSVPPSNTARATCSDGDGDDCGGGEDDPPPVPPELENEIVNLLARAAVADVLGQVTLPLGRPKGSGKGGGV